MKKHWLYREENRNKLWWGSAMILAITVIAEFFIHLHGHFSIADIFGFHAVFGFLSCVAMVLFTKLLGALVKRRDDYYDL